MEFGSSLYGSHVPFVEFGSLLWCLAPLTSWATALEQSANSSSNQPEAMPLSLTNRPWLSERPPPTRKRKREKLPPLPRGSILRVENVALGAGPVYEVGEDEDQSEFGVLSLYPPIVCSLASHLVCFVFAYSLECGSVHSLECCSM